MIIDRQIASLLLGSKRLVNIEACSTDPAYQRPPEREKVLKLAKAKHRTRPIFVNRRADLSLWIIDGQHRALAQRMRGKRLIGAWVVSIPQADEQKVYAQLNGLTGVEVEETSIVKERSGTP